MREEEMRFDGHRNKQENISKEAILYVCDRRACKRCDRWCGHTSDIRHAKNFKMQGEIFVER